MNTKLNNWTSSSSSISDELGHKSLSYGEILRKIGKYSLYVLVALIVITVVFVIISLITYAFEEEPVMILIYSPSCPHCITFKPIWDEFVRVYDGKTISYDSTDIGNQDSINKYKISGVPTVIKAKGSDYVIFEGTRDVNSLINFALS